MRVAHRSSVLFYFVRELHCSVFYQLNAKRIVTNTKPFSVLILEREPHREIFQTVSRFITQKTEIFEFSGEKNGKFTVFLCSTARDFKIKTENGPRYYNGKIHLHQKNVKRFYFFEMVRFAVFIKKRKKAFLRFFSRFSNFVRIAERHGKLFFKIYQSTENKKCCGTVRNDTIRYGYGTKFGPPSVKFKFILFF